MFRLVFLCTLAAAVAWLLYANLHRTPETEADRARGPLTEELFAAAADPANGTILDAVYSRFIASDMPLEDRATFLRENGFGCKIEPYKTKLANDMILRCIRTARGAWGCKGFEYYVYQASLQNGRFHYISEGNVLEIAKDKRIDDRCPIILEQQEEYDRAAP